MAKREDLAKRVLSLLDSNRLLEHHLQYLLVDEVQDCLPEEIEVFFRCATHVSLAGDDGQRLFGKASILPMLVHKTDQVTLRTHYRIGHDISKVIDAVGRSIGVPPIGDDCNYKDAKDKVEFFMCADEDEQAARIIASLKIQLSAYPNDTFLVAAPRKKDRDFLRSRLASSALAPYVLPHRRTGTDDPSQRVYVAHLQEIKGLEFRTAHLAFMENVSRLGSNQKRVTYTAVSRAKTTLSIYFTGSIPPYLEEASVAVSPPAPTPPLADLFPKKAR